jgi:hypothetical protein
MYSLGSLTTTREAKCGTGDGQVGLVPKTTAMVAPSNLHLHSGAITVTCRIMDFSHMLRLGQTLTKERIKETTAPVVIGEPALKHGLRLLA